MTHICTYLLEGAHEGMRPVCERRSHRYPSVTDRLCKASFHGWPRTASRRHIFLCEAHNLVFHDAQLRGRFYGSTHKDLSIFLRRSLGVATLYAINLFDPLCGTIKEFFFGRNNLIKMQF